MRLQTYTASSAKELTPMPHVKRLTVNVKYATPAADVKIATTLISGSGKGWMNEDSIQTLQ